MSKYDVVIVGAGCAGLVSALTLKELGYRVLLLDEHNSVGGLSNSITKGRFEFEPLFHALYLNNSNDSLFSLDKLLKKLGIEEKIDFSLVPELTEVLTINKQDNNSGKDYLLPFGIEDFKKKCNEYVPGCEESIQKFFDLAFECREALKYILDAQGNIDYDLIKENYENFYKISNLTMSQVLDMINMPIPAQEIINSYWFYLGSSETEVSFVQYAVFLYEIVNSGLMIPKNRNYDITFAILNKYLELGGIINYNSKVTNVIVKNGQVRGVKLYDGTIYEANRVIVNSNMKYVYSNLIEPDLIPSAALKALNVREMGPTSLTVYLGLNRSANELGLKNYSYLIYNSLDSDVEESRMKKINNCNQLALVLNNANSDSSPDGTCILSLSTLFFEECFENSIDQENYYSVTSEIASDLIDTFEKTVGVSIREFIEEVEIRTSLNTFGYVNNTYSNLYGFKLEGLDNLLPRLLNDNNEQFISGLEICGGFNGDIYGIDSAYYNGFHTAILVNNSIKGDYNEKR